VCAVELEHQPFNVYPLRARVFIRKNGYEQFMKKVKDWKNTYGKLDETSSRDDSDKGKNLKRVRLKTSISDEKL